MILFFWNVGYYRLVDELGGGQFGTVWSGTWYLRGGGKKNVAVKVCKENAQEQEKARLLREGARMMQFFHTHVVQLYGVVTIDEPVSIQYMCEWASTASWIYMYIGCTCSRYKCDYYSFVYISLCLFLINDLMF